MDWERHTHNSACRASRCKCSARNCSVALPLPSAKSVSGLSIEPRKACAPRSPSSTAATYPQIQPLSLASGSQILGERERERERKREREERGGEVESSSLHTKLVSCGFGCRIKSHGGDHAALRPRGNDHGLVDLAHACLSLAIRKPLLLRQH